MSNILVVNASARKNRSLSRYLTKHFADHLKIQKPESQFIFREVGQGDIPHVTEQWIAGAFKHPDLRTPEDLEALKTSDELVAEIKVADIIIIGTPMYNWSVPSALKAYIDQILRVGETILVSKEDEKNPYIGLLKDKKVYLLMVRGNLGYEPGDFFDHMDFQSEYLKTVFKIMGLEDIKDFSVNGAGLSFEREPWEDTAKRLLEHFDFNEAVN